MARQDLQPMSGVANTVVLFANSWTMGGTEAHLAQLGRGLVQRGFSVAAILSPRAEIEPLRAALSAAGVRVHAPAERRDRLGLTERLRALIAILRTYPGCVLHIHLTGHVGGELAVLAAKVAGVAAIVRTEHNPPVPPITLRDRLLVQLRDRALARVICVSEQARQEHIERLGRDARRCVVINNGIDVARFSPAARAADLTSEFGFDSSAPIVGTVARLAEHRKGIAYFLDMAAKVAAEFPRVRFLVVGDGPLRAELEDQARKLALQERLVFAGERHDIPRLLAAMRVFVLPSLYEACQYNLLEAMAMACPVVSTPVGIAPDVVVDGVTGLLVPVADSAALAAGVRQLLLNKDEADQLGRRGHELVVARFSEQAMVDNIAGVYRELAAA